MHIPDGFLPPSVAIAGYAVTGGVTWYSVCQINREKNSQEKIPKASLLTAAFFLASLIHIPVPPGSIHLVLNGLMGVVLGYYAFPAILIGLFFQAVMFQHGGLSTLGVNAAIMGIPALLAHYIFGLRNLIGDNSARNRKDKQGEQRKQGSRGRENRGDPSSIGISNRQRIWTGIFAFLAGAGALGISASIFAVTIVTNISADLDSQTERTAIYAALIGYGIQALIEGTFTFMLVSFLERVKPELLEG